MVRANLLELEVETPQGKIILKRHSKEKDHLFRRNSDISSLSDAAVSAPDPKSGSDKIPPNCRQIKSPIIGVFYRASSPQSAPFVKEGDVIESGTTICIVEAMKVMNEIKTDCRCRIVQILTANTKPVTKNQPLFLVEPIA